MYFRIVINHSLVALYCIVDVAIYIQHPTHYVCGVIPILLYKNNANLVVVCNIQIQGQQ